MLCLSLVSYLYIPKKTLPSPIIATMSQQGGRKEQLNTTKEASQYAFRGRKGKGGGRKQAGCHKRGIKQSTLSNKSKQSVLLVATILLEDRSISAIITSSI